MIETVEQIEDVDSFRRRARAWIRENIPPTRARTPRGLRSDEEEMLRVQECRALQRLLFEGGFAGLCFPTEYGGQGLTPAHQAAFNEEIVGYDYPAETQTPTITPCAAVILEYGTQEQKRDHLPAILRGDEIWMQLLSEPTSGSDIAAALTTAVRDGDEWILNGSKIWTTGAWWADWGLCLARTNWDVPKHRGLTVFMVELGKPGIEVHRIRMLNGSREFCQEYLTDLRIPDTDRIGSVDDGWTVGIRWMFHERTVNAGSPYVIRPARGTGDESTIDVAQLVQLAQDTARLDCPTSLELIGEARTLQLVRDALAQRVQAGIRSRALTDQAAAIIRLFAGTAAARTSTIAFELAGSAAIAAPTSDDPVGRYGIRFLMRQSSCIAGGTIEMARNVISERVVGMPRERGIDRDTPFRDIPR